MPEPSRKTVGIYDRPHPLRTRKVLVPVALVVLIVVIYAIWAYLRG